MGIGIRRGGRGGEDVGGLRSQVSVYIHLFFFGFFWRLGGSSAIDFFWKGGVFLEWWAVR